MIVMLNRATKNTFSCLKIIFQVLKYRKKEYMEMTEKFYLETCKSVLSSSILHYSNTNHMADQTQEQLDNKSFAYNLRNSMD